MGPDDVILPTGLTQASLVRLRIIETRSETVSVIGWVIDLDLVQIGAAISKPCGRHQYHQFDPVKTEKENMKKSQFVYRFFALGALLVALYSPRLVARTYPNGPGAQSQVTTASAVSQRDGSHDFDFLIGNWKAHVRVLRDRLNGSNDWVEYEGISNHKKLLDSNTNFLIDFDKGTLDLPPVIGQFADNRGEFYN